MKSKIIPLIPERENFASYLRKRKGSNFHRIFGDTNTRWFYLEYNNEFFGYKNRESDKKIKCLHNFSEVKAIREFMDNASKSASKEWKFGLEINLTNKKYLLFAQTEKTQKKWVYEFKIVLRLLPESFPLIENNLFKFALDFYQKPYFEALRKENEEKELKLKQEKENKIKKIKEEKEKKRKEEQQSIELNKQKEEEVRIRIEEENKKKNLENILFNKKKIVKKIDNGSERKLANIYDECEPLISEAEDKLVVNNNDSLIREENIKLNSSRKSNIEYGSNLNFNDDLNDWDFYDEENGKIFHKDLDKYNPIQRVINANKKHQLENINYIKSNTINQRLEKEIDFNKKTKNKVFKKETIADCLSLAPSYVNYNTENKITVIEYKILNNQICLYPSKVREEKEALEKTTKTEHPIELKKFYDNENNNLYKIWDRKLIIDHNSSNSMLDYNFKLKDENIELNLSINSGKNDLVNNKNSKYNFENSMNNTNSLINLNVNDQIPEIISNQVDLCVKPNDANKKKNKKLKNFKKITEHKKKDQAKKLLTNNSNYISLHQDESTNFNPILNQIKELNNSKVIYKFKLKFRYMVKQIASETKLCLKKKFFLQTKQKIKFLTMFLSKKIIAGVIVDSISIKIGI